MPSDRHDDAHAPSGPEELADTTQVPASLRPLSDVSEIEAWAMVESSPDGMILADKNGTMLLVNSQIESLFGYDRGDLLGKAVEELLPDEFRRVHTAHRTRYRANPQPRSMGSGMDLLARRADGTKFPVEVSLSPVKTNDGVRVVATVRDITDRLAAEAFSKAVRHSIDVAHDAVFMFEPDDLRFLYVNGGAVDQLGYSRQELLAMTPLHIKPDFTEKDFRLLLTTVAEGRAASHTFTTVHRRKNGVDVPVEIILQKPATPGPDQAGMWVAFVRDITERTAAADALRTSEEAFRMAFDAAPVGMATVDFADPIRRPILACNRALADLLGYSRGELLTKGFAELTYHHDSTESDDAAQQAATGSLPSYGLEKRYVHADGHPIWVWVHSAVLPEADGDPTKVLVHVADLNDQKLAEAERERSRLWLECLAGIRASFLSADPIDRTLNLICESARRLLDADVGSIYEPNDDRLDLIAFDSPESQEQLPTTADIDKTARTILEGDTLISDSLAADHRMEGERAEPVDQTSKMKSTIATPVDTGTRRMILGVASATESKFSDADIAIMESFATEVTTAMQLDEARQDQSRLRILQDRERLAEDLHDRVIQRIFAAGMGLQSVQTVITDPRSTERISSVVDQLDETIRELRSAIFRLNSPATLVKADDLNQIVGDAARQLGFMPSLDVDGDIESMPGVVYEQLAPTVIEALSNIERHANATAVEITITCTVDTVELMVSDNGSGLNPNAAHGRGLLNLESRARRVGGSANIANNPDRGSTLTWTASV